MFLFAPVSVDDGSEDDCDSHIMVWTLPESPPPELLSNIDLYSPPHSLQPPSTSDSSLELGDTPGSGLALDSPSESVSCQDSDSDTETERTVWSEDVEEMLNNPPPGKFESFNLSLEPSMSSWVVPVSDSIRPSVSPLLESLDDPSPSPSDSQPAHHNEPMEDFTGHFPAEESSSVLR